MSFHCCLVFKGHSSQSANAISSRNNVVTSNADAYHVKLRMQLLLKVLPIFSIKGKHLFQMSPVQLELRLDIYVGDVVFQL